MKKQILLFIIAITVLFAKGQTTETLYLNKHYKPVSESKAMYKKITSLHDGITTVRDIDLKRNTESVMQFKNNVPVGKWQELKDGKVESEIDFNSLVYLTLEQFKADVNLRDGSTFDSTGFIKPSFIGGDEARIRFLGDNTYYPQFSRENGKQGTIYISFILTKEGNIERPTITRGASPHIDYEAVRVIKLMPKWNPATLNGKPIDVIFTMPVRFTLVG